MTTEDIRNLVSEVLLQLAQPWSDDITDQVFMAIERNVGWKRQYNYLVSTHTERVVNQRIGACTCEVTGLHNSGEHRKAKSKLIKTYTRLI